MKLNYPSAHIIIVTYLFSSTGVSYCDKLLLRLLLSATLFCLCHLLSLASLPVLKSDRSKWTKNRPPARGQIESEVVADVSVPRTGERRARMSGGRIRGRRGVGGGSRPSISLVPSLKLMDTRTRLSHSLVDAPSPPPHSITSQSQPYTCPIRLFWRNSPLPESIENSQKQSDNS